MHHFEFFDEIIIIGGLAILIIFLFQRLRIPSVIGFIATGILLGPTTFGIVSQDTLIETLSELGVILLLFTIGLEFSVTDLRAMRRVVLFGGSLQIAGTILLVGTLAMMLLPIAGVDVSFQTAIFLGIAFSVSSTAICSKLLKDRRELALPHGRTSMAILIFQDMAIVPLMIIVSLLIPGASSDPVGILFRLGTLALLGLGIIGGFRYLLPRFVGAVGRISAPEVLVLGALVLCFGSAYITSIAGMSMALGAFIAGVIIAGTDEGHRIGRVVEPMRDAFTSIFFISVGLLLDVHPEHLLPVLGGATILLAVKALVVTVVLMILRLPIRTAVMSGIVLAQVGEFSFVLAETGQVNGLVTDDGFQAMLVAIIVTMTVTPLLISVAPRLAERAIPALGIVPLRRFRAKDDVPERISPEAEETDGPVVVVIGFGVNGQNVARVLRETAIPYRVLEMNAEAVQKFKERGEPIRFGDSTDMHDLKMAGIGQARAVIVAISDQTAVAHSIRSIRAMRPDIHIIARTRYARDAEAISSAGANIVVTEEYESSIQVSVSLLQHLGVEEATIEYHEDVMRRDRYGMLAREVPPSA